MRTAHPGDGMAAFDYARLRAALPAHANATWPLDRLLTLVDGHEAGRSFRQLSDDLATTKNACIGRAHRLGLPPRDGREAKHNQTRAHVAKTRALPPRPPQVTRDDERHGKRDGVPEARILSGLAPVRISDLHSTQCKWPVGDPKAADFAFCGRLKREDGPYCTAHHALGVDSVKTARAQAAERRLVRMLRRFA